MNWELKEDNDQLNWRILLKNFFDFIENVTFTTSSRKQKIEKKVEIKMYENTIWKLKNLLGNVRIFDLENKSNKKKLKIEKGTQY